MDGLLENLSKIPPKPSVPFHDVPPDAIPLDAMEIKAGPSIHAAKVKPRLVSFYSSPPMNSTYVPQSRLKLS